MRSLEALIDTLEPEGRVIISRSWCKDSRYALNDGRGPGFRGDGLEELVAAALDRARGLIK